METLDDTFKLSDSSNSKITHVWLLMAIEYDIQIAFPRLENYLVVIGRGRLINLLYKALSKIENSAEYPFIKHLPQNEVRLSSANRCID